MTIAAGLVAELDHELTSTRSLLAVVPESKADWKPHPKSMTLGALVLHVIESYDWGLGTVLADSHDFMPNGVMPAAQQFTTKAAAIARMEAQAAAFRAALLTCSDEAMFKPWTLFANGKVLFTMPRVVTLRSFIFNHSVHHRGQLTVYLRMLDVPLPQVYGPTADAP